MAKKIYETPISIYQIGDEDHKVLHSSKQAVHDTRFTVRKFAWEMMEYDPNIVAMSKALSKTERFLKIGPYILWFGMHLAISLALLFQRGLADTLYYLVTYFFFGSLVIWFFGFRVFPQYLVQEGRFNPKLIGLAGINIVLFVIGLYAHTLMAEVLQLTQISDQYAPKSVRVALWALMVILGIVYMASIRIARVYYLKAIQKMELKAERAEAELNLLKSQISPHFLFNTLNNIYGLAYLKDERAAEMISKLSGLLRYLLYDCNRPTVLLTKERELIENFLNIQLLKHEDTRNVDFYHAGITDNHRIAPMILINFIENCFKHSDLESNPQAWIKISLEVENNVLGFRTENTFRRTTGTVPTNYMGIGLTNALKLLEANYPGKHQTSITEENNVHQLDLKIML